MKALIRNKGETITENMNIYGIDWKTGFPLTNPYWCGGAYTLVENYVSPVDDEPVDIEIEIVVDETPTETTTTLTQEEIDKQKKIEALEKTLEALKNS